MLYRCTHMATVGVNGLMAASAAAGADASPQAATQSSGHAVVDLSSVSVC